MRGPYGRGAVARLPDGHVSVHLHGHPYYRHGWLWYRSYYYGGTVVYTEVPAPVDAYIYELPSGHKVVVINGRKYYYYNRVYYVTKVKENRTVYMVVEAPATVTRTVVVSKASSPKDPFKVLQAMTEYLGKQKQLTLVARVTSDEVLDSGLKLQLSSQRTIKVSRPTNQVSAEMRGDKLNKSVLYDGKTLTFLDRSQMLYGVLSMPETIDEMLESLSKNYGMTLPLSDLFYTDAYKPLTENVQSGQYVGLHKAGDVACHHLAFTQDVIDWEIWIQAGEKPVPRKLVITYKSQPGTPRFAVDMLNWNMSSISASAFDLKVPSNAARIEVLPVAPSTRAP